VKYDVIIQENRFCVVLWERRKYRKMIAKGYMCWQKTQFWG